MKIRFQEKLCLVVALSRHDTILAHLSPLCLGQVRQTGVRDTARYGRSTYPQCPSSNQTEEEWEKLEEGARKTCEEGPVASQTSHTVEHVLTGRPLVIAIHLKNRVSLK